MSRSRADALSLQTNKPCRRCNKIAHSGLKCVKCDTVSHISCVSYLKNARVIDESTCVCCDQSELKDDLNLSFTSANSGSENTLSEGDGHEISYLKVIIRTKDMLINNQSELIKSLYCQLNLLRSIHGADSDNKQDTATKTTTIGGTQDNVQNKNKATKKKQQQTKVAPRLEPTTSKASSEHVDTQKKDPIQDDKLVTKNKGTRAKSTPTDINKSNLKVNSKPSPILGTKPNVNHLKVVPKKAFLYIRRLEKTTTDEDLKNFLVSDFPEVTVERLEDKYESKQARFKLSVDLVNLEKIQDPNRWPTGVMISRFFHPRMRTETLR